MRRRMLAFPASTKRRSFLCSFVLGYIAIFSGPRLFALEPSKALTQYMLQVWQTEQGLPQNTVYAIRQTRDGYLWLATEEGLVRFDGVRFVVFDKRNTPAIRHNWIQSLLETSDGSLWIAIVGGGLARYKSGAFTSYSMANGLPSESVWDVSEGDGGSLLIATDSGLAQLRNGRITVLEKTNQLRTLHRARDGTLWIGTDGHGVLRMKAGRFDALTTAQGLSSNVVWAIREAKDGSVWIGTSAGLDRLHSGVLSRFSGATGLPNEYVRALYEDRHGALWVGTGGGGVMRYHNGVFSHLSTSEGLTSSDIRSFHEDREGNLWVGMGGGGLARLRDGKFTVYGPREGLFGDNVRAVMEDRAGTMWIGGRGGVTRLRGTDVVTSTRKDGIAGDIVYAFHEDRGGAIWIGTENGLTRFRDGAFEHVGVSGLSHPAVRAIEEDAAGRLWIGTEGGLTLRSADGQFRSFTTSDGLAHNAVLAVHAARDGVLWIGTRQGLNRMTPAGAIEHVKNGGLARAPIISIHEDATGALWFASGAVGLFRLKDGTIDPFTSRQGLFDDTLMETLEDAAGNFWVGCNRGVFRVSKRELGEVAAGRRATVASVVYGTIDGLRSAECNGGSQPAGWKSSDGRLWFSTIRGVAMIDPARLITNPIAPPVVIERITAGTRVWDASRPLELPAGSNDLEIQYTALTFGAPERARFRYQLEGFDRGWVDAGNRRTAYFTNVPPGDYRFRVVASNEDGLWNETGASLAMTVSPQFHQTPSFRAFLVLLLLAAIWGVDRARIWRVRARERWLTELVAERTQSLEEALAAAERARTEAEEHRREAERQHVEAERHRIEAEEASRAKSTFLASMSHELRTPMNSIIGFSEILSQRLEGVIDAKFHTFLTLVRTSSQHLLAIINDILDLSKVEMGKMEVFPETFLLHDVVNSVTSVMSAISMRADVAIRADVPQDVFIESDPGKLKQILFNLLSNAVKFSPPGAEITIAARRWSNSIEIAVTDHGAGIAAEDIDKVFEEFRQLGTARHAQVGTGLGLSLVRKFCELLRGSVRVESTVGQETTFTVELPIRYSTGAESGAAGALSGPTVLVIDDDEDQWQTVHAAVVAAGFIPLRIQSGREALARLKRIAPAAAVLDLALRGGEGWEVLAVLRAGAIPVIVITSPDDSHPATEIGSDVLMKPVQPARLSERLQRAIRSPHPTPRS